MGGATIFREPPNMRDACMGTYVFIPVHKRKMKGSAPNLLTGKMIPPSSFKFSQCMRWPNLSALSVGMD